MNWYYSAQNKQVGPVSGAELLRLFSVGKLNRFSTMTPETR